MNLAEAILIFGWLALLTYAVLLAGGTTMKSQYHTPGSKEEIITWLIFGLIFVAWVVGAYLKASGIWGGL